MRFEFLVLLTAATSALATATPVVLAAALAQAGPEPPPAATTLMTQADFPVTLSLSGEWTAGLSWRLSGVSRSEEAELPPQRVWQDLQLAFSAQLPGHPRAGGPGWESSFFVSTRYRAETPVSREPDPISLAGNLTVDELWLDLSAPHGLAVRAGRLHFQYGPAGLLAANPFDGLAGIQLARGDQPGLRLSGVLARLDTSYVTLLPYVYDTDSYWAARLEYDPAPGHTLGLTLLGDGLASEHGVGVDWQRQSPHHSLAAELAAFRASPGANNYQGWVLGGILSVDLWQGADFLVNMNLGSIHPGFTPLTSNLASAGGNLNFSNGVSGLEINASWLARRDILVESELSFLWRWQRPDFHLRSRLTYGARPGLQYQIETAWQFARADLETTISVNQRF